MTTQNTKKIKWPPVEVIHGTWHRLASKRDCGVVAWRWSQGALQLWEVK